MVSVLKWVGLVVIALGAVYAGLTVLVSRTLHREYAALEAAGRPTRAEQIIPAPVPDPDNAALTYASVVLKLKANEADGETLYKRVTELALDLLRGEDPDPAAETALREWLGQPAMTESLAALQQAAAKPACRFDNNYSEGAGMVLAHLSEIRSLTFIVGSAACVKAAEGDAEAAWGLLMTSLRMADALRTEPLIVSQLVRAAQVEKALRALRFVCAAAPPSAVQYAEADALLRPLDDRAPLVAAMDGERLLFGEWGFGMMKSELRRTTLLGAGRAQRVLWLLSVHSPLLKRDHATYLQVMRACADDAAKPLTDGSTGEAERLTETIPLYCLLSRLMVPALVGVRGSYAAMMARVRVARAGLAVLNARRESGAFPDTIPGLAAAEIKDPFRDQPLVYRREAGGFVIYSVGENREDGGGKAGTRRGKGDIVWRYGAAPDPWQKVELDVTAIDESGLRGPPDGKVTVSYEFCIPDTETARREVKAIDPSVQFMPGSRGRIGAGEGECLCVGTTGKGWREVLAGLAALPSVGRIIECHFE
jgi:hypothetical protein